MADDASYGDTTLASDEGEYQHFEDGSPLNLRPARPASPPSHHQADGLPFPRSPGSIDFLPPVGNVRPPPQKLLSESNKESMYLGSCLMAAVRVNDTAEVAKCLRAGRSLGLAVTMDVKTGKSTLHYAAELGNVPMCRMLVESGGSMVNLDKYGKTPLHCAIVCGQAEVVRYFLTMIEPWHFHAPSKLTVVQTAAKHNELAIMQALLAHGFLDHETNGEGETALHLAARNGSLDVAKVLCRHAMESESRADGEEKLLHAVTNTHGQTALHYACIEGHTELACFLVRRGADAHLPDHTPSRKTPVDKCEDTYHRVTLNAVLEASKEFRNAVALQDNAARASQKAVQTSIKKMETAKVRGMAQLKRQGLREQTFVAKHEAIGKAVVALKASRIKAQRRAAAAAREKAKEEAALNALAEHAHDHHSHHSHQSHHSSNGSNEHASSMHSEKTGSHSQGAHHHASSSLHGGSMGNDSASSHKSSHKSRNGDDRSHLSDQASTLGANGEMHQAQSCEEVDAPGRQVNLAPNWAINDDGTGDDVSSRSQVGSGLAETQAFAGGDEATDTDMFSQDLVARLPSITAPPPPSLLATNGGSGTSEGNLNVARPMASAGNRRGISALFGSGGAERMAANYAEQVRRATGSTEQQQQQQQSASCFMEKP